MKPAPFSYHAPTTVAEALGHLATHGYDASVLAGGQSLVPTMNFRLAQPSVLVDSKGSTGFAKGSALVTLTEQDASTTLMQYEATLQVGGRIASVGQRMLDTVSKSLTRQSLEAMNNALEARLAPATDAEPAEAYEAPTQADFAREVAKDVAVETFKSNKTIWIAAAVVVVVIVWALKKR